LLELNIKDEKIFILNKVKSSTIKMINQTHSAIAEAQAEANYHIGAMESRYDTFKEEAQYLATAQKVRLIELENNLSQCNGLIEKLTNSYYKFSRIEVGAFFSVKSGDGSNVEKNYFIIPTGGGRIEKFNKLDVLCVTIDAPIIKPYIGLKEGDELDNDNEDIIYKII
jgi:hypothetical protein